MQRLLGVFRCTIFAEAVEELRALNRFGKADRCGRLTRYALVLSYYNDNYILQEKVETRKEDVKPAGLRAGLFNFLSHIRRMCKKQHNWAHKQ